MPSLGAPKMAKRQRRPCLECLDGNVASNLPDNREVQKFADEETLVMFQIRDDDFKEVVRFAGNEVTGNYLRHRIHGSLERESMLIGMPIDLDADKHGQAEANSLPPQRSSIPLDVSSPFEPLHTPQARRWGEAHSVRKLHIAQSCVSLQFDHDPQVDRIQRHS